MNDIMTAQEHLDKAHQYENEGKYDEALEECDLAILANPDSAEAYNTRGILLEALGAIDSAVADYEMAVELEPDSETALQNLYDAQNETAFIKRQRLLGTILLTAVAYGFSLMVFNGLDGILNGSITEISPLGGVVFRRRFPLLLSIIFEVMLLSSGIGFGTYLFASIVGFAKKKIIVIYSILGFAVLFWPLRLIYGYSGFLGFNFLFLAGGIATVYNILMFALPGAFTGFLIAKTLDKSKNWLLPTLAGSSLMVIGFNLDSVWLKALDISVKLFERSTDSQTLQTLVEGISNGMRGFLAGAVFGIALVLALFFSGYIYQTTWPFLIEDDFDLEEEE